MEKSNRLYVFLGALVAVGIIFITRLFFLQIVDTSNYYKAQAYGSNEITIYPARGTVVDRYGKLLVYNDASYDLMVVPQKAKNFDKVSLCRELLIDTTEFNKRLKKAARYNPREASVIYKNLPFHLYTRLQEVLYQYPAFYIETKIDRRYNINGAAHLLGYMGEVSERELEKDKYYKPGDIKGITGLEKSDETYLRGIKGKKVVLVDKFSKTQGSFAGGKFDSLPTAGENIISSIDLDLQIYGEQLLANKTGSIVAIEPATGEVLCLINNPNYDPNLLVGQQRNRNFSALLLDPTKPLFNRALKAPYPPGSTFKTVQALIGLQEGVLTPETRYPCHGGYRMGSITVGCHPHASPLDLETSIAKSCNAYYCYVYRSVLDNPSYPSVQAAYLQWTKYLNSFGIGVKTGIDLPEESSGIVKQSNYFERVFGKNWRSSNVVSISIGQGEIGLTPLQMANVAAILANRGYYYTPHVVRSIGDKNVVLEAYKKRHYTLIDRRHFDTVISGMAKVCIPGGTAGRTGIEGIEICGKTGTAQNPHGKDHSIFIAFAPRHNPKIAICCIVENGGFGADYAAPISNLLIERYLATDKTAPSSKPEMQKRMLTANLTGKKLSASDSLKALANKPK
ncbi:MAG: penicillin-binding protein 2 [Bacteroidetes bacterium]|nr:penicillin-binding protein 2 [Bacteroidota bacterium]